MNSRRILRDYAEEKLGEQVDHFVKLDDSWEGACLITIVTKKGVEKQVPANYKDILFYTWKTATSK